MLGGEVHTGQVRIQFVAVRKPADTGLQGLRGQHRGGGLRFWIGASLFDSDFAEVQPAHSLYALGNAVPQQWL